MKAVLEKKQHAFLKEECIDIYFDFNNENTSMQRFMTYIMDIEQTTSQLINYRMIQDKSKGRFIECSLRYSDEVYSLVVQFMNELKLFGYNIEILI